jgi:plastocyanin
MRITIARTGLTTVALLLLVLGIASCGGGDNDTTASEGGATSAEAEAEAEVETQESEAEGSEPAPSGEAARAEKVEIVDFAYDPDPATIQEGGKVIWINRDSAPHSATADDGSFDTGILEEGKLKSETFKEPGEYSYFCTVHPDMHGTVKVVEAG